MGFSAKPSNELYVLIGFSTLLTLRPCVSSLFLSLPSMAASSTRIFHSSNRHFPPFLFRNRNPSVHLPFPTAQPILSPPQYPSLSLHPHHHSNFRYRPSFNPFPIFKTPHFPFSNHYVDRIFFGCEEKSFQWNFASGQSVSNRKDGVFVDDNGPEVAVVLLGWLGAKPKHLRRYVELYNARGIHAVFFVASVMDVLSFDLGRKLEERIEKLSFELVSWLSNKDHAGRERFLIFHTFSNTGWLAYGAILHNLKGRLDIMQRIKGCIVDSGGDPNIDPKVWAAGFTTALLKKNSSATYPSAEAREETQSGNRSNRPKDIQKESFLFESFLLFAFEKLFSFLLNLPDVNLRLTNIISTLEKNQPHRPQLYLYSTGDRVIPSHAVESFIKDQKRAGKQVMSFNFGSSPHVDHYRTFPDVYASQLDNFLKECLLMVAKS